MAQMVEHILGKDEVTGSIPVISSIHFLFLQEVFCFYNPFLLKANIKNIVNIYIFYLEIFLTKYIFCCIMITAKKKRADLIEISTLDGFRHTWLW